METKKSKTPVYIEEIEFGDVPSVEENGVYLKEIELAYYRSFKDRYKFTFVDENDKWCQWTVFLGNNNSGKTNLLKLIAAINPKEPKILQYFWEPQRAMTSLKASIKNTVVDDVWHYEMPWGLLESQSSYNSPSWDSLIFYAYGVSRKIVQMGISENESATNTDNLLKGTPLIYFEDWLFQLDYAAKNGQEKAAFKRDLLKKVLVGNIFPDINDIRFISNEDGKNWIQYQTNDGGWYRLSELGYGYQAMFAWVMDFAKKLFDRYPDSPNPLSEPAILLVDEIDLHLHPYWQRTIIKYLSNLFPQTQFIVTTHSPFILQSMENVNLYTLRREGDHTIPTHLGNRSFVGWGIEEILSEVMELEDDVRTDRYQDLIKQFGDALDNDDYTAAKEAYNNLSKILHPASVERKLMEIQMTQLIPS